MSTIDSRQSSSTAQNNAQAPGKVAGKISSAGDRTRSHYGKRIIAHHGNDTVDRDDTQRGRPRL